MDKKRGNTPRDEGTKKENFVSGLDEVNPKGKRVFY